MLNHRYGGPNYDRPATVYIALYTVAPTDAGGGTEVTGGSYARPAVTNNSTNFPASTGGSAKTNGTTITFPTPTGNWGTIVAVGIFDAASGGNLLDWGAITSFSVTTGNPVAFPPGSLVITED